jgi:hypothetical protein
MTQIVLTITENAKFKRDLQKKIWKIKNNILYFEEKSHISANLF